MAGSPGGHHCIPPRCGSSEPPALHGYLGPWSGLLTCPHPSVPRTEGASGGRLAACSARSPCICAQELLTHLTQKGLLPMEPVSKALWLIILSQ